MIVPSILHNVQWLRHRDKLESFRPTTKHTRLFTDDLAFSSPHNLGHLHLRIKNFPFYINSVALLDPVKLQKKPLCFDPHIKHFFGNSKCFRSNTVQHLPMSDTPSYSLLCETSQEIQQERRANCQVNVTDIRFASLVAAFEVFRLRANINVETETLNRIRKVLRVKARPFLDLYCSFHLLNFHLLWHIPIHKLDYRFVTIVMRKKD